MPAHVLDFLQAKVDAHLENPPPADAEPKAKTAYNLKLRQLRLRVARAKGSHTSSEWDAIVAETGGICVRCGYQHDLGHERPCKAYVLPLAAGGSNAVDNIQPLCRYCATSRGDDATNYLTLWRATRGVDTEATADE